jgi:hypothetical protein
MGNEQKSIAIEITLEEKKVFCHYSNNTVLITKDSNILTDVKKQMEEAIKFLNDFLVSMSKPYIASKE